MKFRIDIDCSPEEARQFFGLPDVRNVQESIMAALQERVAEQVRSMDLETLTKTWLPTGAQGWDAMQKAFMKGFADGGKKHDDQS
ncbi:MAG: DUF6489 family protein [Rhodospirillales bacterium]|nr:DUF6489 family protein [Rhodospirillales bacterium]